MATICRCNRMCFALLLPLLLFSMLLFSLLPDGVAPRAGAQESGKATDVLDQFDEAMQQLADEVAQYVKSDGEAGGQISVGTFRGPAGATASPKMIKMLKDSLAGKCKVVELGSVYSVGGKYFVRRDASRKQLVIVIEASIYNRLGAPHLQLRRKIVTDMSQAPKLFGLMFDASRASLTDEENADSAAEDPPADGGTASDKKQEISFDQTDKTADEVALRKPQQVADAIEASFKKSKLHIVSETVVHASKTSPYGIEIVEKGPDGEYVAVPLEPELLAAGIAKVQLNPEQPFAVRIYNRSSHLVGVDLSLDGINVFEFSHNPFWKKLGKMLVQPGRTTIKGWHDQGASSFEFLVTSYGNSAAASLGVKQQDASLGTITATFYEIVPVGSRNFGIGRGERTVMRYDNQARPVQFGGLLGAVSIKYNRSGHPDDLPPPN